MVALAGVAILNAKRHVALTREFNSAFIGAENVDRINSLIYAVVMESRGIYMSPDIATAKKFAAGLNRFNDQIGAVRLDPPDLLAARPMTVNSDATA